MRRFFGLFLIPLSLIFSCATVKELKSLEYQDVKNFSISKLDLDKPEVGMDVQFFNPNDTKISIKNVSLDLYINNTYIGKAKMDKSFDVPAKDTFLLPVVLAPDFKNVFPNALQLIFNKEVTVQIKGIVTAGKGIMLNIPIDYKGKQKLNIF